MELESLTNFESIFTFYGQNQLYYINFLNHCFQANSIKIIGVIVTFEREYQNVVKVAAKLVKFCFMAIHSSVFGKV